MTPLRDDYLIRMIEQAFQVLRRLARRGSGEEAPAALQECGEAIRELLGPAAEVVERMDAATAAALLADPTRVALWACLLAARAELLRAGGDPAGPAAAARALAVASGAVALERERPGLSAEVREALDRAIVASAALASTTAGGVADGSPPEATEVPAW